MTPEPVVVVQPLADHQDFLVYLAKVRPGVKKVRVVLKEMGMLEMGMLVLEEVVPLTCPYPP